MEKPDPLYRIGDIEIYANSTDALVAKNGLFEIATMELVGEEDSVTDWTVQAQLRHMDTEKHDMYVLYVGNPRTLHATTVAVTKEWVLDNLKTEQHSTK